MLYFAYGSNLNLRLMKRHAARAKPIGAARLDGYKLMFRKYLDIAPEKSGVVWGAVYEITPACERALDAYEDFPKLYRKITVSVNIGGKTHEAMAYVMGEALKDKGLSPPTIAYFTLVEKGYREWKLDTGPLKRARLAVMRGSGPI